MPCSGASSATSFRSLCCGDQIDIRGSRPVDRAVVGDEADPFSAERRRQIGEEHLDAGSNGPWGRNRGRWAAQRCLSEERQPGDYTQRRDDNQSSHRRSIPEPEGF